MQPGLLSDTSCAPPIIPKCDEQPLPDRILRYSCSDVLFTKRTHVCCSRPFIARSMSWYCADALMGKYVLNKRFIHYCDITAGTYCSLMDEEIWKERWLDPGNFLATFDPLVTTQFAIHHRRSCRWIRKFPFAQAVKQCRLESNCRPQDPTQRYCYCLVLPSRQTSKSHLSPRHYYHEKLFCHHRPLVLRVCFALKTK